MQPGRGEGIKRVGEERLAHESKRKRTLVEVEAALGFDVEAALVVLVEVEGARGFFVVVVVAAFFLVAVVGAFCLA